jgi:hypothetical protein
MAVALVGYGIARTGCTVIGFSPLLLSEDAHDRAHREVIDARAQITLTTHTTSMSCACLSQNVYRETRLALPACTAVRRARVPARKCDRNA